MEFPTLTKNNIYAIPAGDFWEVESNRIYIIYAPLNGQISLATHQSVEDLEKCALSGITDNTQLLNMLKATGKVLVDRFPDTPHDLYQIDLLINYTCNFKCTYCYSAAGRSSKEVDFSDIKAIMDYLFCSGKKQNAPYIINFSGGGEPLISFPLIKQTVEYIELVSAGKDYKYELGLVTNGSLITPEIVEYLKRKEINMAVSFEILQEFQDMERGSYNKVAANIDMMLDMEFLFGIRTTFTPESVRYMTQMVEELSQRFPRIKKVVFDTVLSPEIFQTPEMLRAYYDDFIREYFVAKERGEEMGINVESIAVETLTIMRDRTCEGKIVLTPNGAISSCARVSSPKEQLYDEYVYGKVEDGKVFFDENKFRQILSENNIYGQEFCHDCFAKWNCGGGCRLFHQSFSSDFLEPKCEFTKQGLRQQIFNVLKVNHYRSQKNDLHKYISEKITVGDI